MNISVQCEVCGLGGWFDMAHRVVDHPGERKCVLPLLVPTEPVKVNPYPSPYRIPGGGGARR